MSYGDDMGWGDIDWGSILGGGGQYDFGMGDGGSGVDVGADPYGGSGDSGYVIDPSTGDFYDRLGNFVGNVNTWGSSGAGGSIGGGALGSLAKALGLTGKDGSLNLSSLLPMLLAGGGGLLSYNATNKAANSMTDAINKSNQIVTDTLGGNKALYQPYADAGAAALQKMQNLPPSNLAGQFKSLGSGKGLTLGQMSKGR